MNKTERVDQRAFFADFLLPLKYANVRKNIHYFDRLGPKETYWGTIVSRTGGLERLSTTSVDSSKLIEALGHYWNGQKDPHLPKLVPYILALRAVIVDREATPHDRKAPVREFVYPLF